MIERMILSSRDLEGKMFVRSDGLTVLWFVGGLMGGICLGLKSGRDGGRWVCCEVVGSGWDVSNYGEKWRFCDSKWRIRE